MTEEKDIDALAAEYVLGSLDAAERADVEARCGSDASLRASVEAWQRHLTPLSELVPGVTPPSRLWSGILSRISVPGTLPSPSASAIAPRWNRGYGRRLAIGAAALAACFAIAVVAWYGYRHPRTPVMQLASLDCGGLYKDFWRKLDLEKYARISAEQLAGVSRMALRAYDACQAGDEPDADALFGRLRRMRF